MDSPFPDPRKKNGLSRSYRLLLEGWSQEALAFDDPGRPILLGAQELTVAQALESLRAHGADVLWALEVRGNHREFGPPWGPIGWGRWPHRYLELIRLLDDTERSAKSEARRGGL